MEPSSTEDLQDTEALEELQSPQELLWKVDRKESKEIRKGRGGVVFFLQLTSWWFGWNVIGSSTVGIIWPSQIASLVGDEKKELFNGLIPAFGA